MLTKSCPGKYRYWKCRFRKIEVLKHAGTKNATAEIVNAGIENALGVKLWYRRMPVPENFGTGNSDTEHAGTRKYLY